ncbi:MAG: SPOR domain-containing protein [Panacagrimonas sp.]
MAKDYAARNRRPAPKGNISLPGWVWLVAGLSMGLVVAAIVYIGRPTQPMPMAPDAAKRSVEKPKLKVSIPPREEPRFDFYTLLEKEQVIAPVQAPAPPKPTAPAAPAVGKEQYLIVVGAFENADNADEHKAKLAMTGMESSIEKITGQDRKTWHRVRIGPEPNLARAQTVLSQLQGNGFDGRIVKLP